MASANPPIVAGAANVWAPMSVDEDRGLVFLPTTSPSPDFWGGLRPGDDGNADAVVAVCKVAPGTIDRRGLHRCNLSLLRQAASELDPEPEYVLTDGFPVPRIAFPSLAIKKGDAVCASVAAASVPTGTATGWWTTIVCVSGVV